MLLLRPVDDRHLKRSFSSVGTKMSGNRTETKKRSMTFIILYYWGKLLGLNPLTLTKNNVLEFSYFSLFYNGSLVLLYTYVCYRTFLERLRLSLPDETPITPIVDSIAAFVSFFEVTLIWLIFPFRQNRILSIVKGLTELHENFKQIGIFENPEKHIERLAIYLFVANGFMLFGTIINDIAFAAIAEYNLPVWTFYSLGRFTSISMIAIFAWCMDFVRQKFCRLNKKVRFLMENGDWRSRDDEVEARDGLIDTEFVRNSRRKQIVLSDRISLVSKLHRKLRDAIRLIEQHFELLIMMDLMTQLIVIPLDIYMSYCFTKEYGLISNMDVFYFANLAYWAVFPFATMSVLVNACGSTSFEANKTGNILHAMLNNHEHFENFQESAKIIVLSLDLLQNRVRITLFGLVELDYFLLYRTVAAATTYLVIMLQFYS